ncbi:unnamed protein product [Boreogadus saida]
MKWLLRAVSPDCIGLLDCWEWFGARVQTMGCGHYRRQHSLLSLPRRLRDLLGFDSQRRGPSSKPNAVQLKATPTQTLPAHPPRQSSPVTSPRHRNRQSSSA